MLVQTQKHSPAHASCFWTGARRAGSPHRCARAHRTLSLLRHRRRAIARGPDAGFSRIIGSPSGFRCLEALAIHLHAPFKIVQQLALQGHPVPLHLLPLRKPFLTPDGITLRLETLAYASGVFASEAVVRTWSILSRGSTGLISIVPGCPRERWRLISRASSGKKFVQLQNTCWRVSEFRAMFRFRSSGIIRSPDNEKK